MKRARRRRARRRRSRRSRPPKPADRPRSRPPQLPGAGRDPVGPAAPVSIIALSHKAPSKSSNSSPSSSCRPSRVPPIRRFMSPQPARRDVRIVPARAAGLRRFLVGDQRVQQRDRLRRGRHQRPWIVAEPQAEHQIVPRRFRLPPFRQLVAPGEMMLGAAQRIGMGARIDERLRARRESAAARGSASSPAPRPPAPPPAARSAPRSSPAGPRPDWPRPERWRSPDAPAPARSPTRAPASVLPKPRPVSITQTRQSWLAGGSCPVRTQAGQSPSRRSTASEFSSRSIRSASASGASSSAKIASRPGVTAIARPPPGAA